MAIKLGRYFDLDEFTHSEKAIELGIANVPDTQAVVNLTRLTNLVLDPVREESYSPIVITSGYRCKELNTAIGGVGNSQHQEGLAADIIAINLNLKSLYNLCCKHRTLVDQCILEPNWVHISIAPLGKKARSMFFTQK